VERQWASVDFQFSNAIAWGVNVMLTPPCFEFRRYLLQFIYQCMNVGFFRSTSKVASKTRQHQRYLFFPVIHEFVHCRVSKQHPQQISTPWRLRAESKQLVSRCVESQYIPAQIEHISQMRSQVVHEAMYQRRYHAPGLARFCGRAFVSQQEQVPSLRGIQLQHPSKIVQKCGRYANIATLFQP